MRSKKSSGQASSRKFDEAVQPSRPAQACAALQPVRPSIQTKKKSGESRTRFTLYVIQRSTLALHPWKMSNVSCKHQHSSGERQRGASTEWPCTARLGILIAIWGMLLYFFKRRLDKKPERWVILTPMQNRYVYAKSTIHTQYPYNINHRSPALTPSYSKRQG